MHDKRREICKLVMAPDCYVGLLLLFSVPVAIAVLEYSLILSVEFQEKLSSTVIWSAFMLCMTFTIIEESMLFLLLFGDPGVTYEGEDDDMCELSNVCPICRIRVQEFDHHCSLLGACIGAGTMPYFIGFLFISACLAVLCFIIAIVYLIIVLGKLSLTSMIRISWWTTLTSIVNTLTASFAHVYGVVAIVLSFYFSVISSAMLVIYLHKCVTNRYSLKRRRKNWVTNNYKSMFISFMKPSLARRHHSARTLREQELISLMTSSAESTSPLHKHTDVNVI